MNPEDQENRMRGACSRHWLAVVAAVGALAVVPPVWAASPPALAVSVCSSCHGSNGVSPYPTYPNLAGQKEGYIEYALHQYQMHQRLGDQADVMSSIAANLSADDIKAVAAYFASLTP